MSSICLPIDLFLAIIAPIGVYQLCGLKKACKQIGLDQKTLHDLRDTYIVRLWAMTGDIHLVSTFVGHSDIKQTIEYARFTPHELLVHFPSLKKYLEPRLKVSDSVIC